MAFGKSVLISFPESGYYYIGLWHVHTGTKIRAHYAFAWLGEKHLLD